MLRIYHIAKIEGKLLERILHIKKKKKKKKTAIKQVYIVIEIFANPFHDYSSWHKRWTLVKGSATRRATNERYISLPGSKKKKNRTSRPLSSRWRKERTTKRKKRCYSGDKDRSLTPHCFPFPFYWVTWRDPRSNFPPDSTTSSPFGPRCEKVIRVKLRSRPRIALRHDNTSVIAWQIFF